MTSPPSSTPTRSCAHASELPGCSSLGCVCVCAPVSGCWSFAGGGLRVAGRHRPFRACAGFPRGDGGSGPARSGRGPGLAAPRGSVSVLPCPAVVSACAAGLFLARWALAPAVVSVCGAGLFLAGRVPACAVVSVCAGSCSSCTGCLPVPSGLASVAMPACWVGPGGVAGRGVWGKPGGGPWGRRGKGSLPGFPPLLLILLLAWLPACACCCSRPRSRRLRWE
jgi:hypothetical protein